MFSTIGTSQSAVHMAQHYSAEQVTDAGRSGRTQPLRLTVRMHLVTPRWWGSVSEALRHGRPVGGPGVHPRGAGPGKAADRGVPLPRSGLSTQ
jgi:hypothetical protein